MNTNDLSLCAALDELDRLRAEVASLKEELRQRKDQCSDLDALLSHEMQQLAAANGRVEKCRKALHRISLGSRNSMTSKESLGKEAQAALSDLPEADKEK